MLELLKEKTVIGIIVTIILGAIGSGLWDIAIKPFFKIAARYLLKIYTFGLERFKNPIYQSISQGKVDISTNIYTVIVFIFLIFPTVFCIAFITPIKREAVKQNFYLIKNLEKVTKYKEENPETKETLFATFLGFKELSDSNNKHSEDINRSLEKFNGIVQKYEESKNSSNFSEEDRKALVELQVKIISATNGVRDSWDRLLIRVMIAFGLLSIFTVMYLFYPVIRNIYINDSISYFEELLTICKPYIGQKSYDILKSSFAQIQTKEDYVRIINELQEIAQKNKATVREFNIL